MISHLWISTKFSPLPFNEINAYLITAVNNTPQRSPVISDKEGITCQSIQSAADTATPRIVPEALPEECPLPGNDCQNVIGCDFN
jgi:hypothetical protein